MTGLTVKRERLWGQWKRKDKVLVRLPADPDSYQNYLRKGLTFIRYGKESDIPMAVMEVTPEQLKEIAPVSPVTLVEEKPPLYVSDKPYKSKKKRR
jgi:hypothetical protein